MKLCINCLKGSHTTTECSSRSCLKCHRRHNTLLHEGPSNPQGAIVNEVNRGRIAANGSKGNNVISDNPVTLTVGTTQPKKNYVLLGTVTVKVMNHKGKETTCRALLDCGSQLNFVTENLARKMGLKGTSEPMYIQGIGESRQRSQNRVSIELKSRINGYSTRLEAFTLPQIISPQPSYELDIATWPIPPNIELADPHFHQPSHIDILIGAELYYHLLSIGQIRLGAHLPTLQNTVFGWIVTGSIHGTPLQQGICGVSTSEEASLEEQMEKFWKMEEVHTTTARLTVQETMCENHFSQTTERNRDGRFIVRLPFIQQPNCLGESSDIAFRRLLSMEKKLGRNEELSAQYKAFMNEYLDLGHMKEVDPSTLEKPYCFLPHHAVIKPESSTTKLRVAFDASAKTSSNVALNNILGTGPTLQDDLFTILLRFRTPRFVITADIEKMYRQIRVHPEDRKYQLILWRDDPAKHVKCYELQTITYGTTSAPYLATKCLQKLAMQSEVKYPLGSSAVKRDFYVDDLMTGTNSLAETLQTQREVREILRSAGFNLRKWCANHPQLLQNIPREEQALQVPIHEAEDSIKTLGLTWLPKTDEFSIRVSWPEDKKVTKRTVLSDIARLFDPLGIMSPVVVTAKIFLQQLWHLKLDWDASLPMDLHTTWTRYRQSLNHLKEIRIPRHTFAGIVPDTIQIHAFSDASEKAYGAAVYLRSTGPGGAVIVRLLCAKSRVAPIKTITLPRLELCAARLSAELVTRIKTDLKLDGPCFYWSDSEIVLAWINSQPALYPTFVANRIASIQELTTATQWRHVRSRENPADIVSRGLEPERLSSYTLWFYGPIFLHGSEKLWPPPFTKKDPELERKVPKTALAATKETSHFMYSIDHKNNLSKWQRIVAYILRFVNNSHKRTTRIIRTGYPSIEELDDSLTVMVREVQKEEFKDELRQLQQTGHVNSTSFICSLSPFIDDKGIIRVGGRLEASELPYEAKHPILIPKTHQLTRLLMTQLHLQNLHAAPQALLAITRQRFWPVKGKTIARSVVQNCVQCAKAKPRLLSQFMGDLPAHRVQQARPFINAGVDFFGPCWIHFKSRGKRPQKAYVAVFCCFATKATHLEVVSDLTSSAFIAALKRFIGRRGNCRNMYCDNATNFVGAKNRLADLKETLYAEKSQQKIAEFCVSKGIEFHFIPPRAPHFGGLWEAAVKSAKHILQRNIASASLTYEELETLMVEIEAVLNSRPLTPISSDPNDLSALTPGHFLIGEPTTTIIDPAAQPPKVTLLQRWKLVTHLKNQFWLRWSHEYLSELQHRHKWKQQCNNVQPGTMVVIKEDNLPVTAWKLGRIIKTIKGNDGLVRVADIKTTSGILRRPIHNLAPLPIINDESHADQQLHGNDPSQLQIADQGHKTRRKHKAPTEALEPSTSDDHSPVTSNLEPSVV